MNEERLRVIVALAKAERIQRLCIEDLEIEFAPDAFRPPAQSSEPITPKQREEAEKKRHDRRVYGSSVG